MHDVILDILTDLGDLYAKAEPSERRMLNRALFTKITIDDEETVTVEAAEPVATDPRHRRGNEERQRPNPLPR